MKKAIIITLAIVLFSAIMVACNIDATLGIYSEVAQSTPSTDVVLKEYLGYDTTNSKYFYLSDDGVYTLSSSTTKKIIASDDNQRVVGAFMESETELYVLVESKLKDKMGETTLKYSANAGESFDDIATSAAGLKGMLSNGFCWNDSRIYFLKDGALTEFNTNICNSITVLSALNSDSETEDEYAFFSLNETTDGGTTNRFYVLKYGESAPKKNLEGDSTYYCGFQYIGGEFYFLYKDTSKNLSYVYKLNGDKFEQFVKLNFNLKFSKTQNATFYDPGYGKLVVKCSTYFDEVYLDTQKVESVKNKYASNICTADITNFKLRDAQVYVVGTVNSMLYTIDMGNPNNTPVQIK